MKDARELIGQAARGTAASKTTSPTPPGQSERSEPPAPALVEAINQVFALFRLNYHNQYFAAYPDGEQLKQVKKLWLESLGEYPVAQILLGARHAIETSEYLPTLHRMHESCRAGMNDQGLPAARDAYLEACRAPSPKSGHPWSHPAVYLAGRDSDWFFLANSSEQATWPVYRDHYQRYVDRVLRGETLSIPERPAIERREPDPLPREQQQEELRKLRQRLEL